MRLLLLPVLVLPLSRIHLLAFHHVAVADWLAESVNLILPLLRLHSLQDVLYLLVPLPFHRTHLKFSFPAPISKCSFTMPRSILV